MKKILIEYNPFEKELVIKNNDNIWTKSDNKFFDGYTFDIALTGIIEVILNDIFIDGNCNLEIEFIGRELEYKMLKEALNNIKEINDFKIKHNLKYDIKVSNLIKKIEKLDKKFFKRKDSILKKLKALPEVYVLGNYGTGKSTFLNAILKKDILYTDVDVATNKLLYIVNDKEVKLLAFEKNLKTWKQQSFESLKEKIEELNKSLNFSDIKLFYPIKNVDDLQVEFIDTPGVNNAVDERHRRLAFDAINNEIGYPLVVILIDAQNYKSTDQAEIFNRIKEKINSKDKKNIDRFLFIINKADMAYDGNFKKFVNEVKNYLFDKFQSDKLKIFFTNSLLAQALYKKENGEKLLRRERHQIRDIKEDLENNEAVFLPEYSTVLEYDDFKKDCLVEYSGVPFVEKYIKNYLINTFEVDKIKEAVEELNRIKQEYYEKIKNDIREIEITKQDVEILKKNLSNKDFKIIFQSIEKDIKNLQKELSELDYKIKKFEKNLEKIQEDIEKISLGTDNINNIIYKWNKEINYIKHTDIIEKLNSLGRGRFNERNIKDNIKSLFGTTSDFKCSEINKYNLFLTINSEVDKQLNIFKNRYLNFLNDFKSLKSFKERADLKFKNSKKDLRTKKEIYEEFSKKLALILGIKDLYSKFNNLDKIEQIEEEIEKFLNSAISALEDEIKHIEKLELKNISEEKGIFSKEMYCNVNVLLDKVNYLIEKDKGIYKYYYILKRLPEISIELVSEFEAQFQKNIFVKLKEIKNKITQLIQKSDLDEIEKLNLETINLQNFDKFMNIFLYRDALEENRNTIFNLDIRPGREWISHIAKYIDKKELEKINISFRKEFQMLQDQANQFLFNIKNQLKENVKDLQKELEKLRNMKKEKVEELKLNQEKYKELKNDKRREEKIKKEISKKEQYIKKINKEIQTYERLIEELTIKDI